VWFVQALYWTVGYSSDWSAASRRTGRLHLVLFVILLVVYIKLLFESKPWKFQVNQSCDFWFKIDSCAGVLFVSLEGETQS
jgi:hypothetical protein